MTGAGKNIVVLCFGLFLILISFTRISDYDFWWHLQIGEAVYNSGEIIAPDSFSYTFNGMPQWNGEWLGDLLISLSFKSGGFIGVNILKASLIILTFLFLFLTLKNEIDRESMVWFYSSISALIIIAFSIRFRLYIRPFLFSYLFLSTFLFIISRYGRMRDKNILYLLPLVEVLWANTSKIAVYGPLIFFLFIIGEFFNKRSETRFFIILAAIVIASMLNPETYDIYSFAYRIAVTDRAISMFVGEHQPLSLQILWGYGLKYTFAFQLLAIGSVIYFIFFRGWKNLFHMMLFIIFFMQALNMVRMIDFFSLVAGTFAIKPIDRAVRILPLSQKRSDILMNVFLSILILVIIIIAVPWNKTYTFGIGAKENIFPEGAIAFLDKEGIKGNMFNSYPFGGYIMWHSPARKVFIDGRGNILYTPDFFKTYQEILKSKEAWKSAEERWGIDYALLEYDIRSGNIHFPMHLVRNPDWALVYWDNHSAVYLKRTEENFETIKTHEYKITNPNLYDFSYLDEYLHTKTAIPGLIEQINQEISLNPLNQEPRLAKAFILYNMGTPFYDEALKELEISLKLKPDMAMEHSAKAFIMLAKGLTDKARDEVNKAIAIDPYDPGANYLKDKIKN